MTKQLPCCKPSTPAAGRRGKLLPYVSDVLRRRARGICGALAVPHLQEAWKLRCVANGELAGGAWRAG